MCFCELTRTRKYNSTFGITVPRHKALCEFGWYKVGDWNHLCEIFCVGRVRGKSPASQIKADRYFEESLSKATSSMIRWRRLADRIESPDIFYGQFEGQAYFSVYSNDRSCHHSFVYEAYLLYFDIIRSQMIQQEKLLIERLQRFLSDISS